MNRQPYRTPDRWWAPAPSPRWVKAWAPFRRRGLRRGQRIVGIELRGVEHLRAALDGGAGVLIAPNHSAHWDSSCLLSAADAVGRPFYIMTAWQVFAMSGPFGRWNLRRHGCFSVDREGTDRRAFKQATDVLEAAPNPLVIFPEGDIYHTNDRVTPFRDGAAGIALAAARKAARPVVVVPCAIRFRYVEDPTPQLLPLMDRLERRLLWQPRPDLPLAERIYRFAGGLLALKEVEYGGRPSEGPIPQRVAALAESVLTQVEARHGVKTAGTVPERVKELRRAAIKQFEADGADGGDRDAAGRSLEDLFLATQLYSYPGDYVAQSPTPERMAETLDKFEEDVLGADQPAVRGPRRVTVLFGEPVPVPKEKGPRGQAAELTATLERRVQELLDQT